MRVPRAQWSLALMWVTTAGAVLAAEPVRLPTSIVMTEADCEEICTKRSLRGRPVNQQVGWEPRNAVWKDAPVFRGTKAGVLAWFKPGPQRKHAAFMGGFRGVGHMRNFQYDLLCDQLLRTGDLDIVRAVIWNCHDGSSTGFLLPTWQSLFRNRRLDPADRLAAWLRWWSVATWPGEYRREVAERKKAKKRCWDALAPHLRPADIAKVHVGMQSRRYAGYAVWELLEGGHVTKDQAGRILLPIVADRYLQHPKLMACVIAALRRFPQLHKQAVAALGAAKPAQQAQNLLLLQPRDIDPANAKKVRTLALHADAPRTAGRAFWTYVATATGLAELKRDGGRTLLPAFVAAALKRPPDQAREALQALIDARPRPVRWPNLAFILARGKADIVVTPKQFDILKAAWKKMPKALDYVVVEDQE